LRGEVGIVSKGLRCCGGGGRGIKGCVCVCVGSKDESKKGGRGYQSRVREERREAERSMDESKMG